MGDPSGIGPEVVVKALADEELRSRARFVIYGMNEMLAYGCDLAEIEPFWWRLPHDCHAYEMDPKHGVIVLDYDQFGFAGQRFSQPTRQGGEASLMFLRDGIRNSMLEEGEPGRMDALVTAPICKESWTLAGERRYAGHTEMLMAHTRAKRAVMMFVSSKLRVALATTHVALNAIQNQLTIGRVFDPIELGCGMCERLGVEGPRVAVCGLNPHASENGLFGDEEERIIRPAIEYAREQGIDAHGPYPADSVFIDAAQGKWDMVVAMYHDQGLIPVKLLGFEEAVNVTLGLPIIRTSPDHGTAFDLVGKNQADPRSMKQAIELAIKMVGSRNYVQGRG